MLHLVAEQYDSPVEGIEYELFGPERIAQLEQEDLERYQRSILKNSSYQVNETPDYQDELQSKLLVLMDMMHRFSTDLKATTSPSENGSEQVSIISAEACDEQQQDEVLVVNELPDSAEMLDFDDIHGNDSPNSAEIPNFEETTVCESGLQVLSIYCAHMASKWKNIIETRPTQRNDMSVEIYYTQFFDWRKKLDEVGYIGGEESYIDDFIYGLEIKLGMRVWGYKWKPHTLYGAFRRAKIEETLMGNDAHMVFNKNAEQIECEYELSMLDLHLDRTTCDVNKDTTSVITTENLAAGVLHDAQWLELAECSRWENNVGPVFGNIVVQKRASKVFVETTEPILEEDLLSIEVIRAANYMLNEMPTLSPVNSDEGLYGNKDSLSPYPYIIQTGSSVCGSSWNSGLITNISKVSIEDLSYRTAVLGVSDTNSPSWPKLGFNPQVFDPGTLSLFIVYAQLIPISVNSATDLHKAWVKGATLRMDVNFGTNVMVDNAQHMFHEMSPAFRTKVMNGQPLDPYTKVIAFTFNTEAPETFIDGLQGVDGLLMFTFDPGISSWHLTYCVPLNFSEMHGSLTVAPGIAKVLFCFTYGVVVLGAVWLPLRIGSALFLVQANEYCTKSFCEILGKAELSLRPVSSFVACKNIRNKLLCVASRSLNQDVQLQGCIGDKVFFVEKVISCWISTSDGCTYRVNLASSFCRWLCLLSPMRAKFAWDPGICVISAYILEDKDVFKRVGKWIILMDHRTELLVIKPNEEFVWIDYFDRFNRSSKERVVFLKKFSTPLVRFVQLPCWSPKSYNIHNSIKIGLEQIDNYVNDWLRVGKSYFNKAHMGHSEILCNDVLMKGSSVEPYAIFCSNTLNNGGGPCIEATDVVIKNPIKLFFYIYDDQGNDPFMPKTKRMAIQLVNWHSLIHSMVHFCDDKHSMHATIATHYSMHLWDLMDTFTHLDGFSRYTLPRSHTTILYGHSSPDANKENNVAIILPNEPALHSGTVVYIMMNFKLQDGVPDDLKTSLTNGIGMHIEMMNQGRHIDGVSHEVMDGIGSAPNAMTFFFTIEQEHYIWDPGWFVLVSQLFWEDRGVDFHFTTLRTRRLLRGRICHESRLKLL